MNVPLHPGGIEKYPVDFLNVIRNQFNNRVNSPLTSSVGRLFDAVASIIGIRQTVNYEAQAAIELEAITDPLETKRYSINSTYEFIDVSRNYETVIIDPGLMIEEIVADLRSGQSQNSIGGKFHNSIAGVINDTCQTIKKKYDTRKVFLSGGVWQNPILFTKTLGILEESGFEVYYHRQVPCNDGGLALGQAAIASLTEV
jgi:hydrogenase maturation protein HypF